MRVFISWSGPRSHALAEAIRDWLSNSIQSLECFLSSEMDKGTRWGSVLNDELATQGFGILCMTPENLVAPWILFEAGALGKLLESSRVCPVLYNLKSGDLEPPLNQFTATVLEKDDMGDLLKTINKKLSKPLDLTQLSSAHEWQWSKIIDKLTAVDAMPAETHRPVRSTADLLSDLLERMSSLESLIRNSSIGLAPGQRLERLPLMGGMVDLPLPSGDAFRKLTNLRLDKLRRHHDRLSEQAALEDEISENRTAINTTLEKLAQEILVAQRDLLVSELALR